MTNEAESSLLSEVKVKQYKDPILLDLKSNVNKRRVLAYEKGGDGVLKYQGRLCVIRVDGSKRGSWRTLIAPYIPFIRIPSRCTTV